MKSKNMKQINTYINEKLKLNKDSGIQYNYHPQTREELDNILLKLLDERGPDADLNDIDVSNITDMGKLFMPWSEYKPLKNLGKIDISQWDVSNVKYMDHMFRNCINFNCDLSEWDVGSLVNANSMFYNCPEFNSDISNWDVSNLEIAISMFNGCESFKANLNKWDIKKGVDMKNMFKYCISLWDKPKWYKE